MNLLLWILMLFSAILAAHWGAEQLSIPLQKLRKQWGLSEAAGAAFIALATASPEIGTDTVSAEDSSTEKLYEGFIGMLCGAKGMVEVNKLARSDQGLQKAFDRERCALV